MLSGRGMLPTWVVRMRSVLVLGLSGRMSGPLMRLQPITTNEYATGSSAADTGTGTQRAAAATPAAPAR